MTEDEIKEFRAWRVTARGFSPVITVARSRGRAVAKNLSHANEAGYRLKWTEFHAVRSREHDKLIPRNGMFSTCIENVKHLKGT